MHHQIRVHRVNPHPELGDYAQVTEARRPIPQSSYIPDPTYFGPPVAELGAVAPLGVPVWGWAAAAVVTVWWLGKKK